MSSSLSSSFMSRLLSNRLVSVGQLQRAVTAVGEDEAALAAYLVGEGLLTRFQARQLRAGSASLVVGNYVVVDFIGRGGNGIVLKACHRLMPGRFVALKTIETRNLHASADVAARFGREIQIVSRLDHPNVVRALDVIRTRTQMYLVLEYVAGRDLGKLVQDKGPLPIGQAVGYVIQAARGLAYAHRMGVVHRDLKPTNLLLTENDVVKIADMGLARFFSVEPDLELTLKGLAIGTPEYMAPEQAEDASAVDPRSDLYSLGATLFHLLTGLPSITGTSYLHKLQRLLTAPPRPLAEVRRDVPPELAEVVDRLRSRRPDDRPATAEETIALLEPFAPAAEPDLPQKLEPAQLGKLVLRVLRGEEKSETICETFGLSRAEWERYQRQFIDAGQRALHPQGKTAEPEKSRQWLQATIGAQQLEIEELKRQLRLLTAQNGMAESHGFGT